MSDGWDHILDPDETILWQDSPAAHFVFKPSMMFAQEVHDTSGSESKRSSVKDVGFHQIKDGHKVYRMFRDIQTQVKGEQP